ncbi:MAG: polysaccharide biosynthesis C-terminal domain-containing protein [Tannerella sp.]|nr:polysaccharide biosynthesis C-terminal domain-containing protein [Tannerella sp.]
MTSIIKKILETIGVRYFVAALSLALIFVNAKVLGVSGMGLAGLIYASANIAVIFSSVLCGSTIVYFMNRYDFRYVFWPAYGWAFTGSAIACAGMIPLGMLPAGFEPDVYALAVILSLVTIHSRILLGKGHIRGFNITYLLQGGLLFFSILFFYLIANVRDVRGYVWGLYATNGLAWGVSLWLIFPYFVRPSTDKQPVPQSVRIFLKEMFVYGLWSSADNLAENLTARLNYFLLQRLSGYSYVGLLDAGTKISESVWHISRSVSFISLSQIAKTSDMEVQRRLTLRFIKLTFCAITFVMGVVLLIPEWVYTDYLFSAEFTGISKVIRCLAAGIITLGCNSIFSHYFIGTGKVKYSTICSCIGLLALLLSGYFLIPAYGVSGAALSTSIAFTGMLAFSLVVFIKLTGTKLKEFFRIR